MAPHFVLSNCDKLDKIQFWESFQKDTVRGFKALLLLGYTTLDNGRGAGVTSNWDLCLRPQFSAPLPVAQRYIFNSALMFTSKAYYVSGRDAFLQNKVYELNITNLQIFRGKKARIIAKLSVGCLQQTTILVLAVSLHNSHGVLRLAVGV